MAIKYNYKPRPPVKARQFQRIEKRARTKIKTYAETGQLPKVKQTSKRKPRRAPNMQKK